jgi:cytochrome b pre-mRNA-processing protein 3
MMPLRRFLDGRRRRRAAHSLYTTIIEQARQPDFYLRQQVPDSLDGRFDLIVLHAFLVMRGLGRIDGAGRDEAREVSQELFDLMFADMEQNLRELGVSDMAVGKRVKHMAQAFYGRVAAYDKGLGEEGAALEDALLRNLYGTADAAPTQAVLAEMASYLRRQDGAMADAGAGLVEGRVSFAPLAEAAQ